MRGPDHMPTIAAGHAVIAVALGMSLLVMATLAALPMARLLAWMF